MLRGVAEIVGPLINTSANLIKSSIELPQLKDPENAYWIYGGELPSFRSAVVGTADIISTIHPNYLLVAATFVASFFILYIKMKYPFWNQIPALHVYDWHRRFFYSDRPFIIHAIPKKTKYYESRLVKTERFQNLEESRKIEIAKLLQNHYLPSDRVFCSIQVPDLAAQCSGALVSTWNQIEDDIVVSQESGEVTTTTRIRAIEGVVTSRKIVVSILLGKDDTAYIVQEPANYIDYLCFDRNRYSVDKVRRLFHTHEYNERTRFPDRNITVFKKEVELCDAIVPLVEYETLTFYLRHKIEPRHLPTNFQVVRIQREHLRHLHDWMERVVSLKEPDTGFKVSITAEIGDLIHLLQTNQMFAYALRGPDLDVKTKLDAVYAIYFFREEHMKYEDLNGGDTLHATTAFWNTTDFELYFLGFLFAVRDARKDLSGTETKMLMIDDLGHLRGIAKRWQNTHDVVLRTKCAYYFCNYVVPRMPYDAGALNILI